MRAFALIVSALGTLLFGGLLLLTYVSPITLERAAREIVRIEVERRVGEKIDVLTNARIVGLAEKALKQTDADIDAAKESIRRDVPGRVAGVVAEMLKADCECRRRMAERARTQEHERLGALTRVRERLVGMIESAYGTVRDELLRELRIVSGSNAVAFALLGVVTLIRQRATWHLLLPLVVLVGAVLITSSLYLLNQNWLHTIVFGNYVGWGYAGYLGTVGLLLSDLAFNRGRVCTQVINTVLEGVSSSLSSISPC
ncbi:hypothetical protein [Ottowia testudinis]|uniref:Uncharacterized protein n=1 Tax=Ottowia testudinis TaxID=2816950 RepID=A0A975CGD4_9BURK|nr:hypothetical protein [Ottowia testudinis]QTD45715.1 hypothetical protein J1M35_01975 [Ottowia testudinis]